jgi:hypothetical protein
MGKAEASLRTPKFRLCAGRDACGVGPREAGATFGEFGGAVNVRESGGERISQGARGTASLPGMGF